MDFFSKVKTATTKITDLDADYCIDTSGSTAGNILQHEKASAEQLMKFIKPRKIISWNDQSHENNLNEMSSGGLTHPSTFVPLITDSKSLILYTDGYISTSEMKQFTEMMLTLDDIPIIVIFTLTPSYDEHSTIQEIQRQVNMSIPEACLTLSSNVCVVVNISGAHRILMRKGCFSTYSQVKLTNETVLDDLPVFDMTSLSDLTITFLPKGMIWLNSFDEPVVLEKLYAAEFIPDKILEKLCDRVYFPNLDLNRMHTILCKMQLGLNENPELADLRKQLAEIAVSDLSHSEQHTYLIDRYKELKRQSRHMKKTKSLQLIQQFQCEIADYRADNTSFVLGSNRANRANIISDNNLADIGDCVQIDECPIYLQDGSACILLKKPASSDFVTEFTGNYYMEAPFELGTKLVECMTPGVFCHEIAQSLTTNPYTRELVLGFVPLSKDPAVIMRHMGKIFGGREMWHLLRAYISMVVYAMDKYEWVNKDIMTEQLNALLCNYNATKDLKGGTDKVPLRQALEYVLTNYATCLRDRFPDDVRAIIKISDRLMPGHRFCRTKILGMVEVIESFTVMLWKHKHGEDMKPYVMKVDDWGHYIESKTGIQALIANLFWYDHGSYKGLKLQMAINKALTDHKFGQQIHNAFNGLPIDRNVFIIALPEPTGDHFGKEKYDVWTSQGLSKTKCAYCGAEFIDTNQKNAHMRKAYGEYHYNGHLAVLLMIHELGQHIDTKTLFVGVMKRLFYEYGEHAGFLHTQRCKKSMIKFIEKMKQCTK